MSIICRTKGSGAVAFGHRNCVYQAVFLWWLQKFNEWIQDSCLSVLSWNNNPDLQRLGRTAQLLGEPCSCTAHCYSTDLVPQATAEPGMKDPEAPGSYGDSTCGTSIVQASLWLTQKIQWLEVSSDTSFIWPSTSKWCSGTTRHQTGFHETAQNFPTNDGTPVLPWSFLPAQPWVSARPWCIHLAVPLLPALCTFTPISFAKKKKTLKNKGKNKSWKVQVVMSEWRAPQDRVMLEP